MKMRKASVATLLAVVFSISAATAQESINSAGGNASGSGGSASYSVGQVACQTHTGTNGSVAESIQQPYEISAVTGVEKTEGINLSVSAYPNPTVGFLKLKVDSKILKDLSYQLYDLNGNLLQNKKFTSLETQVDMSNCVPSTYFVRVISGSKAVKEFKIIKN